MKLASHYNRVSIMVTLSVLVVGAVIYFFAINNIAAQMLDDHLSEEVSELLGYVNINQSLPKRSNFDDDQAEFVRLSHQQTPTRFYDTVYHAPQQIGYKPGRAVQGQLSLKGDSYKFIIIISRESTEYFVQIIATITLLLTSSLFIILFLTNRYLLNGLWKPFYNILAQLKDFDVAKPAGYNGADTEVNEFIELDKAVLAMAKRVNNDYQNLKSFTENASHEMMTPLSVIRSKLDTLIQDETLQKSHYDQIADIYSATGKLSKLNQSLLLLVKIENNLLSDTEEIELSQLIMEKLRQFQELSQSRKIVMDSKLCVRLIKASKYLIDILLNNLFSNAIRHNVEGGAVNIYLSGDKLMIQNTGAMAQLDEDAIFDRFRKGKNSDGVGLGLTIAKNICIAYGWELNYWFAYGFHSFQIRF